MIALPIKSKAQNAIVNRQPIFSTINMGIKKRAAMKIGITQQLHGQNQCASTEEKWREIKRGLLSMRTISVAAISSQPSLIVFMLFNGIVRVLIFHCILVYRRFDPCIFRFPPL